MKFFKLQFTAYRPGTSLAKGAVLEDGSETLVEVVDLSNHFANGMS